MDRGSFRGGLVDVRRIGRHHDRWRASVRLLDVEGSSDYPDLGVVLAENKVTSTVR